MFFNLLNQRQAVLITAISGMMYGLLGFFGIRLMQRSFSVYSMLFWRFFVASLFISIGIWINRTSINLRKTPLLTLFLLGAIFYGATSVFYFIASTFIGTGLSMVIFFSYPLFVITLAWKFDRRPVTWITGGSILSLMIGLYLLSGGQNDQLNISGILFALGSSLAYALYVYLGKKLIQQTDPMISTWLVCLSASVSFLIISFTHGSFILPQTFENWKDIIAIGLICTAAPILLLFKGLKSIDSSQAAILSVLEPVVTVIVGSLFLGEILSIYQLIGIIIILGGAILSQFDSQPIAAKGITS